MTAAEFFSYDPFVIEDDSPELVLIEDEEPTLDTAEGEELLLGVTAYS